MPYCSNCGLKLNNSANFCPKCGAKVTYTKIAHSKKNKGNLSKVSISQIPKPKIIRTFGKVGENLTFALVKFNKELYDLRYWHKDGTPAKGIRFDIHFLRAVLDVLRDRHLPSYLEATEDCIIYRNNANGNVAKIYRLLCCTPLEGWDGWNTELTVTSWNSSKPEPVFDIRQWKSDHTAPRKGHGLTLTANELEQLLSHFETAVASHTV